MGSQLPGESISHSTGCMCSMNTSLVSKVLVHLLKCISANPLHICQGILFTLCSWKKIMPCIPSYSYPVYTHTHTHSHTHAVIDFISSYSSLRETTVNFGCMVRSYPFVFFRSWSTRAGVKVNGTRELRLVVSIEVVLVNTLVGVSHLDCIQAGGYSCEYASGLTIFHNSVSVFLECPIGNTIISF